MESDVEESDPLQEYKDEDEIVESPAPDVVEDVRPPLDRAVQVDALLENWRARIRNAGIKAEEIFLEAIKEIFETEKEKEASIAKNTVLELNNTVETEIASLENEILYLATKGRGETDMNDALIKELNKKITAAGKRIRNHAVEIRYIISSPSLNKKLPEVYKGTL